MPFVQMENISHFLKACEMPPLSLPAHDRFLTVDLFDSKDPAQVLQCIAAFSRRASAIKPSVFPRAVGARSKGSAMSPQGTGSSQPTLPSPGRERDMSNTSETASSAWNPVSQSSTSGRVSPVKTPSLARGGLASSGPISSWSTKDDEKTTAPAWNIHQYGYMGGASQGNQGVTFGARRQITSSAPHVPSLAEKERRRKEEAALAEIQRLEAEQAENRRRAELEAEEERARIEEARRWEEETARVRERERREAEEERRRWEEEQQKWKEEEIQRQREERELEARLAEERNRSAQIRDDRLNGQFLSQYQTRQRPSQPTESQAGAESTRIQELERQLAEAKERERQYELERQARIRDEKPPETVANPSQGSVDSSAPPHPASLTSHEDEWQSSEREDLRRQWREHQILAMSSQEPLPPKPPRPTAAAPVRQTGTPVQTPVQPPASTPSVRPLPNPDTYAAGANRTDRFLLSNPPPAQPQVTAHRPHDFSTTTEVDMENQRRMASQQKTKAGGWASKSLLEREMERERERQREWEESQKQMAAAARDQREGSGPGQSWDINQYGFMGGDNQNRGGPGLGVGGARRQIIGPRPPP